MRLKQSLKRLIRGSRELLFLILGTALVLLPINPGFMSNISRDSGVFLYSGWRLLNGELLYKDVWDHKPPMIHFINGLGLFLSGGSRWGIWIIEVVSLFVTLFFAYLLIKKIMGNLPARLSLILLTLSLAILIQGGNLTSEYILPLQFTALWLAQDIDKTGLSPKRAFIIGILSGIAFFTRQNSIGVWVAIASLLVIKRISSGERKKLILELLIIFLGVLAISLVMFGFFASRSALQDFLSAAFSYNFTYISTSNSSLILGSVSGLIPLLRSGLLQFAILGWGMALLCFVLKKKSGKELPSLIQISFLVLPLDFLLLNISSRSFPHYFILLLPTLTILAGFAIHRINAAITPTNFHTFGRTLLIALVLTLTLKFLLVDYVEEIRAIRQRGENSVVSFIQDFTSPNDFVLIWGAEASINFLAERQSPTRFVYQYPLYQDNYTNEDLILEFINDVINNKPRLIIDSYNPRTPLYDFPIQSQRINQYIEQVKANYQLMKTIGSWAVYVYGD